MWVLELIVLTETDIVNEAKVAKKTWYCIFGYSAHFTSFKGVAFGVYAHHNCSYDADEYVGIHKVREQFEIGNDAEAIPVERVIAWINVLLKVLINLYLILDDICTLIWLSSTVLDYIVQPFVDFTDFLIILRSQFHVNLIFFPATSQTAKDPRKNLLNWCLI